MDKISFKNAAHVAFNLQYDLTKDLPLESQKAYPQAVASFAEALRPEIPTIWTGHDNYIYRFYHQKADWPAANPELRSETFAPIVPGPTIKVYELGNPVNHLQLNYARPKTDEVVSEEGLSNPFASDKDNPYYFHKFLKAHDVDTLIVTGMNTNVTVKQAIAGAVSAGYKCVAVIDLIKDSYDGLRANNNDNPTWHKSTISANLSWTFDRDKVAYMTQDAVLAEVKGKVPLRQWKAPVGVPEVERHVMG